MNVLSGAWTDLTWDMVFDAAVQRTRIGEDTGADNGYALFSAVRATKLLFSDWRNRMSMLWTVTPFSLPVSAGVASYQGPSDADEMLEMALRDARGTDYPTVILGRTDYMGQANKAISGRSTSVMVDRQRGQINLTLFPVPTESYTLVGYYLRKPRDVNVAANIDLPQRFTETLVSGLAYFLGKEKVVASTLMTVWEAKILRLEADYEKNLNRAIDGDRSKGNLGITADLSAYRC